MQYKVIIRHVSPGWWQHARKTAISQVTVHYRGPYATYLPVVHKNYGPD
jgi:hypothetical protein